VAYGLHWEWRGFGVVPAPVRERIERLEPQFDAPAKLRDEYLRIPGCRLNLKLRSGERPSLKFKRLRRFDPATGLELWEERAEEDLGLAEGSATGRVKAARSRVAEAVRDLGLDGAVPRLNYVEAVGRWAEGRTLGC